MNIFPSSGRMARVILSLSTAVLFSGASIAIPMVAGAQTTADIIAQLQSQIAALTAQLAALSSGVSAPAGKCVFTRDLSQGVSGSDVQCLQKYLNSAGYQVSASGAGAPGQESTYFGSRTRAAVSAWQAGNGVSPTAGYFGSRSRARYDVVVAGAPTPPGTPTPPTAVGSGLTVFAAAQPGDSLAPLNASRVPATKVTLTAAPDGDVRVNSITVERQGPAADSSVASVVLLDENGLQIGLSKTLNSNHQAILNEKFTVRAGTSRTVTVSFNRPATGSDGGGILKLAVVAIDAGSSRVSGALPVVGSPVTLNSTLTIGTATLQRGVQDPGSSQTKEIGSKGYIFAAIRMTAGSAEDVSLQSIAWNQSGSAGPTDLANLVVNVDGTNYPVTVSSDGKYYTASVPGGLTITKGNQKEMYIKGDVENGSNRTVDFDLYRYTDIYAVGKQYGYGITPTASEVAASADDGNFHAANPNFDAFQATIGTGTITVTASTAIPAQNIAINLSDQPFGAFDVDVKGESVTVSSMVIRISRGAAGAGANTDIDNVSLYDNTTGKVVAGPLDNGASSLTFTDAVTFPVGKRAYVLKGKLTGTWSGDQVIAASTTPNSNWTSVRGDVSGTTITPADTGVVTGNTMTVKSGAVNVSLASSPTSQSVVRGAIGFTFATIVFDASASGEDVRFTSAQVQHNYANAGDITNCALFDGTTQLNTGTNIVNPSAASALALKDNTFTLDTNLTVAKGTAKNIALKCDISKSGSGDYAQWTFSSNETFGATGLTSGSSITPGVASSSVSNRMAFTNSGTLAVSLDASSPSVALAQAGQAVTVSKLKFSATNEDMIVQKVALIMTNVASTSSAVASSTPSDIEKISLWDGATLVGEITATSSGSGLIVTTTGLTVPKGTDKTITVKTQLAPIGIDLIGRPGHLVAVDFDQVNLNGNSATYAVGGQSSSNVYASSASVDTASAGVRVVRAYPTVSILSVPSTSLADASQKALYRLSVSAPAGTNGVSLYKFTFNIATTGDDNTVDDVRITNARLFAFTGSNFTGGKYTSDGQLNNGGLASADSNNDGIESDKATTSDFAIYFNPVTTTSAVPEAITISAGETVYFELRGDVVGADAGDTATIQLMGDSAWFPAVGKGNNGGDGFITYDNDGFLFGSKSYSFATSAPFVDEPQIGSSGGGAVGLNQSNNNAAGSGDDFIWSGNSTTTHSGVSGGAGPDWSNGFVIPGLPSTGAQSVTFTL